LLAAAIAVDKAFIQQQGIALALAGDVHGKLLDQRAVAVTEHAPGAGVAVKKSGKSSWAVVGVLLHLRCAAGAGEQQGEQGQQAAQGFHGWASCSRNCDTPMLCSSKPASQ
jgi:hypothetical protein